MNKQKIIGIALIVVLTPVTLIFFADAIFSIARTFPACTVSEGGSVVPVTVQTCDCFGWEYDGGVMFNSTTTCVGIRTNVNKL